MAKIALIGAAAYFTFGASLGIAGAWSAKVGLFVSKIGLTGKMAGILSGAIVQAGQGALVGGITGKLTGQGFVRGAKYGAAVGAVTGGVAGAIRPVAPGLSGGDPVNASMSGGDPGIGSAGNPTGSLASPSGMYASNTYAPLSASPKASAFGNVWEKIIGSGGIGPIVTGVGAGLARGAEQRAYTERDDKRQRSYDVDYTPISQIFSRSGKQILASTFAEA